LTKTKAEEPGAVHFHAATPILCVTDLQVSLDYYQNVLGFTVDFQDPGIFASVSREKSTIFLCQGDQGHPGGWVWIGVGDAGRLHDELRSKGAVIRHPPTNYSWAYEMQVADPDGNVLRFGSDRKDGQPFGEWLDMHGRTWS